MKIACVGAGSWGTAVASLLTWNGHDVTLWAHSEGVAGEISRDHTNQPYLPGVSLPEDLGASHDPETVFTGAELIVVGIPSKVIRESLRLLKPAFAKATGHKVPVVSLVKGIENGTYSRMSELIKAEWELGQDQVAVLSGPNHAEEVIRRIPSATVIAGTDAALIESLQGIFMNKMFRVYVNPDIAGVELCGATKNVIAIAAGISDGLGYGDNTKATLMTRGLAEMSRLGLLLKASQTTFAGLAGIGDLIATCTSLHSRNRGLGEQIGRGRTLEEITASTRMIAEGVATSRAVVSLAGELGVDLPISHEVVSVLYEGKDPRLSVGSLMSRDPTSEQGPI